MSDYNLRGITHSDHRPSFAAYFEPRYNFNDSWQVYLGLSGKSISFPNRAAAEIDFYGGIRPTFGKLALDFGVWYYWYLGWTCFTGFIPWIKTKEFTIEGEAVVLGPDGLSNFEAPCRREAMRTAILYAFGAIEQDCGGLRDRPFLDRNAALVRLLREQDRTACGHRCRVH